MEIRGGATLEPRHLDAVEAYLVRHLDRWPRRLMLWIVPAEGVVLGAFGLWLGQWPVVAVAILLGAYGPWVYLRRVGRRRAGMALQMGLGQETRYEADEEGFRIQGMAHQAQGRWRDMAAVEGLDCGVLVVLERTRRSLHWALLPEDDGAARARILARSEPSRA